MEKSETSMIIASDWTHTVTVFWNVICHVILAHVNFLFVQKAFIGALWCFGKGPHIKPFNRQCGFQTESRMSPLELPAY